MPKPFRHYLASSTAAIALFCVASPVFAQTPNAPDADNPASDELVVTGTRLSQANNTSISPVTTIDSQQIDFEHSVFADELFNTVPQVAGGIGAASGGNDSFGASVIDLRGLGQNRTLVLIDGTRGAPFGFRNSVDVNSIPTPLLERVEVLTGGASTVYGADALVGVVNFKIRRDFEGFQFNSSVEISDEGDGRQNGFNVTVGTRINDRGYVSAYLGYADRRQILAGDRDFSSPERTDTGIINARPAGGTFGAGANLFSFTDQGAFTRTGQRSDFSAINSLVQPLERIDGAVFFGYDVHKFVEVYGRGLFSSSQVSSALDPVERTFNATIRSDNPFLTPQIRSLLTFTPTPTNPGGETTLSVQRSFAEFGPTQRNTNRTNLQGQIGARGEFSSALKYDAYIQYGRSNENNEILGDGLTARLTQAANATVNASGAAVCVDSSNGCVAANLFGPNSLSAGAVGFIAVPLNRDRLREQIVAGLTLSGTTEDYFKLPAGAIEYVFGFEYRDEDAREINDGLVATGQTFEQGTRPSIFGGFNVYEFFTETRIPLLANLPLVKSLNFEGGYRRSAFSTTGGSNTYKLGGNWVVTDDLRFRGSYQTAIRSPNVGELFGPIASIALAPRVASGRLVDPCSNPAVTGASVEQCRRFGAPTAPFTTNVGDALFIFGGNPNLQPETAKTFTVGTVYTPNYLKNLTLSVDYFDIDINGGLFVIFPEDAARDCYIVNPVASNPLCSLVPRGANGQIRLADVTDRNVSSFGVNGLDIAGSYRLALPEGWLGRALTLRYAGSVTFNQTRQNSQFTAEISCEGTFGTACALDSNVQAAYRHFTSLTWSGKSWRAQASWQRIGGVGNNGARALVNNLPAQNYLDLASVISFGDHFELSFGIDNIIDNEPPLAFTNQENFNTFPNTYDVVGRRFSVGVRFQY